MSNELSQILRELKEGLAGIYQGQLKAIYLYGSYAREEALPPDSDIDVMIVLQGEFDPSEEEKRSADFIAELCLEHDIVISWLFASETEFAHSGMPLMINVRREGVAV